MRRVAPLIAVALCVLGLARTAAAQSCVSDAQCAAGTLCDGIERCVGGTCQPGPPLDCNDGDPCTTDSCNPTAGCVHRDDACPSTCGPGSDGQRCSDGSACTVGDTCSGGACVGTPVDCDDGDPCTTDTCDAVLGCTYVEQANPPACVSDCHIVADHTPCPGDGDPCTLDGCLEGACQVGLRQFVRQCDDNDRCNGDEYCSPVKGCQPGPAPVCDDGNACNGTETCAPATGCQPGTPAPDGTACDDGFSCTTGDACVSGECSGVMVDCDDANAATSDFCTEATGCLHCTPMSTAKLSVTFPAGSKPGKFTLKGAFSPPAQLDPTTGAGADLLLHDGVTVYQSSHVSGGAFVTKGTSHKFIDKTGTVANGLTKLQLKDGTATKPAKLTGKGHPSGPTFGGDAATSMTVVAGPACTTTTLPCTLVHAGKARKCQLP